MSSNVTDQSRKTFQIKGKKVISSGLSNDVNQMEDKIIKSFVTNLSWNNNICIYIIGENEFLLYKNIIDRFPI